jgi:alkylation response protein AidB-like acyl-CoA dehydrogenase
MIQPAEPQPTSDASSPGPVTAALLLDGMSAAELDRARAVESVLPALRAAAETADRDGAFHMPHIATLSAAGLLGLVVPPAFGGMGGGLRDLAAATFAMGTACPSTALAYFFHCSTASRGLLALEALEAGLFDAAEAPVVRAFAEKLLGLMGRDGRWLANFASESAKSSSSAVTIGTQAAQTEGGWLLNGVKSFGASSGVADAYLVTAMLEGYSTAEGLGLFLVAREAEGVALRQAWDAIGMRATANNGITLTDVFVSAEDALAVPGSFAKMVQMSRGTFVGNQVAGTAIYVGAAQSVYDFALHFLRNTKFEDTGKSIAQSDFHQVLIGNMAMELESAYLWLRRQIELESSSPPIRPKHEVVRQWRLAKGSATDHAFNVGVLALKACGTSNTRNGGVIARGLRDLSLGLVQAFPAERGRLMAAELIVSDTPRADFGGTPAKGT